MPTFFALNMHSNIDTKAYDQIIESLAITFINAKHIKLLRSLTIQNFHDVENFLILLNKGQITYTQEGVQHTVAAGEILFIPGGQSITITYGAGNSGIPNNHHTTSSHWQYFQAIQAPTAPFENFSYVAFDAKVFNTVNLFTSLGIQAFVIKDNTSLSATLKNIFIENSSEAAGSSRMVKIYVAQLVIELVRHLIAENIFIEKLAAYSNYFKDPRLISILHYIKENLHGDLSNSMLATVAHVSEDYAGQYFKVHTGVNAQDYIEYQRMEQAVKLLRTTQKSIRDIGKAVGFKDTAYFCRRFKMKFGTSAGKMRSREPIIRG
jgi:AraC-like DNA-binding protein